MITITQSERKDMGLPYRLDKELLIKQIKTRLRIKRYNRTIPFNMPSINHQLKKILGKKGKDVYFEPPFRCDYGSYIEVGNNLFANYGCIILDSAKVTIGDNCKFGPNVCIFTAGHPIHHVSRNSRYEYGIPISIGNNVWIGGGSIINPGVNIGDNVVIGSGSVVTKDIPENSLAVGNPCKVIKRITEDDKKFYFKDRIFDNEAWAEINK